MKKWLIVMALGIVYSSDALLAVAQSPSNQPPTKTSSSADAATRSASFVVGSVGGTPVALVRRTWDMTDAGAKQWTKEVFHTQNKIVLIPARLVTVTYALVFSVGEAPFWSLRNAWKHSADQPFSKDVFSLGPTLKGN